MIGHRLDISCGFMSNVNKTDFRSLRFHASHPTGHVQLEPPRQHGRRLLCQAFPLHMHRDSYVQSVASCLHSLEVDCSHHLDTTEIYVYRTTPFLLVTTMIYMMSFVSSSLGTFHSAQHNIQPTTNTRTCTESIADHGLVSASDH